MIFVDASALVAILKGEPDAAELTATLLGHVDEVWVSAMVRFEVTASLAVSRAKAAGRSSAQPEDFEVSGGLLDALLSELGARDVLLTATTGQAALKAAATYGKLVGHPARLNMGDCFAYACAKSLKAPLLYKGEDFVHTDLA